MNNPRLTRFGSIAASVFIASALLLSGTLSKGRSSGKFNQPGNILITDQFNNRVIESDPAGNIVWHFGTGRGDPSASAIVGGVARTFSKLPDDVASRIDFDDPIVELVGNEDIAGLIEFAG